MPLLSHVWLGWILSICEEKKGWVWLARNVAAWRSVWWSVVVLKGNWVPFLVLVFVVWAGPGQADDLLMRFEIAQERFDRAMLGALGGSVAAAEWTDLRREKSGCALRALEESRGRKVAEKYVKELEKAAASAEKAKSPAKFTDLMAKVHKKAGLKMQRDLVPITNRCKIGL